MRIVQIVGLVAHFELVMGSKGLLESCDPQIVPATVDRATRSQWCSGQITTCGTLCAGKYDGNSCDPESLCYTCTCSSNSSSPALQYYTQTMPTFQCQYIYQNCITSNSNDVAAQKKCLDAEQENCGHLDPDTVGFSTYTSRPIPSKPLRLGTSGYTDTATERIITMTTTVTPEPTATGTITVWSTSTAGAGTDSGAGVGGNGTKISASGNFSSTQAPVPGLTSVGSVGVLSTRPETTATDVGSGGGSGAATPSTVSEGGAESMMMRMRIRGNSGVWGVLLGVVGVSVGWWIMGI